MVGVLAVEVTRFGGPEVLVGRTVPDPVPERGRVVVAVAAAHVLFVETQIRRGRGGRWFDMEPPYVPGAGVAGRVSAVGEGVEPGWIGRRVAVRTEGERGGYAERVVVRAADLVPVPDGVDLFDAVPLLTDGPTALALADAARPRPGQWVLVAPAAGGLGVLLVQLARAAGARVVAAARGGPKLQQALRLGAEVAVDYSDADWAERVRAATGGRGPDVVFDGVGGRIGMEAFEVTAQGGFFSAHGRPSGQFTAVDPVEARRRRVRVRGIDQVRLSPGRSRQLAGRALAMAAEGRLRPVVGRTFPLERAADAHAVVEARKVVGTTLLTTAAGRTVRRGADS